MSSVLYQNKARNANSNIDNATTSISDSISVINDLISRIPNNGGYDALGRNTSESLTSVQTNLSSTSSSFESVKTSIMNKAILEDQKLDWLKRKEEQDGNINEE